VNTKAVNSVAGVILDAQTKDRTPAGIALALDAAGLILTPEIAAEVNRLRDRLTEYQRPADEAPIAFALTPKAELGEKDTREGESTSPATLTIYRAEHDSGIPLGLYTTEAAARAHCEATASHEHPGSVALSFDWIDDESEPEEPRELTVTIDGDEETTGYIVTPLTVASEYDAEADA
jgi:hypothetical protein